MFQPGRKLRDYNKEIIIAAYRFYEFNKTKTANCLDISIRTLDAKLEEYGLKPAPEKNENRRAQANS